MTDAEYEVFVELRLLLADAIQTGRDDKAEIYRLMMNLLQDS